MSRICFFLNDDTVLCINKSKLTPARITVAAINNGTLRPNMSMILLINNNVKALIYNAFRVKFSSTFAKLKFKTNQATDSGNITKPL